MLLWDYGGKPYNFISQIVAIAWDTFGSITLGVASTNKMDECVWHH